jgi:hypothetical protein
MPTKKKAITKKVKSSVDVAIVVQKEVDPVVEKVMNLAIQDQQGLRLGVEYLSQLNQYADRIKKEKERITKPLNEALKAEHSRWKPLEDKVDSLIQNLRVRIGTYKTESDARAKEAAEELSKKVLAGKVDLSSAVGAVSALDTVEERVTADSGSVSFMEVLKFEVVDFLMLPSKFKVANEVEIRKALKAGEKVDGVKSWKEQVPVNRR